MVGPAGVQRIEIPSNYQNELKFLTLQNLTDNSCCIYPPEITEPTAGQSMICLAPYAVQTIPILTGMKNGFNVVWTNPSNTNLTIPKTFTLIFSDENLNMNVSMANSFLAGVPIASDVNIVTDLSGLATEITLAAVLAKVTDVLAKQTADPATQTTLQQILTALWGPVSVSVAGNSLIEQQTQANAIAGVLTFGGNISTVGIYNTDAVNAGIFIVNEIPISVPAGKEFKALVAGFSSPTVTVTGATSYIVSNYN
jgi:hypothetical protein